MVLQAIPVEEVAHPIEVLQEQFAQADGHSERGLHRHAGDRLQCGAHVIEAALPRHALESRAEVLGGVFEVRGGGATHVVCGDPLVSPGWGHALGEELHCAFLERVIIGCVVKILEEDARAQDGVRNAGRLQVLLHLGLRRDVLADNRPRDIAGLHDRDEDVVRDAAGLAGLELRLAVRNLDRAPGLRGLKEVSDADHLLRAGLLDRAFDVSLHRVVSDDGRDALRREVVFGGASGAEHFEASILQSEGDVAPGLAGGLENEDLVVVGHRTTFLIKVLR